MITNVCPVVSLKLDRLGMLDNLQSLGTNGEVPFYKRVCERLARIILMACSYGYDTV